MLDEEYVEQALRDARRFQGAWTGTAGTLAAHTYRLVMERKELLATIQELERKNAELRQAVERRLAAADVPAEIAALHPGVTFVPAEPQKPAEFRMERVGASLSPEQLEAAWGAVQEKAKAVREKSEPIAITRIDAAVAALPAPTRPSLIGLAGRAGSGKNAVAGMIHDAVVVQLADPLYAAIAMMLGVPEALLRHQSYKSMVLPAFGKTPRQLLQTLGTEWGRGLVGEDVWIKMLERRLDQFTAAGIRRVVVADVRFDNEAAWIRSRGGQVWHIYRDGVHADGHASEAGVTIHDSDVRIDNSGTIEDLRAAVEQAMS